MRRSLCMIAFHAHTHTHLLLVQQQFLRFTPCSRKASSTCIDSCIHPLSISLASHTLLTLSTAACAVASTTYGRVAHQQHHSWLHTSIRSCTISHIITCCGWRCSYSFRGCVFATGCDVA